MHLRGRVCMQAYLFSLTYTSPSGLVLPLLPKYGSLVGSTTAILALIQCAATADYGPR
ncbi:hypothetical protein PGT21_018814 [Puccinia graminis f. sp. tritici]|uniref:Uncharacterized protein n=1 Tax=Puccinia graminis f. sp. tritici TaxID=56615 RepID=A0A5B0LKZ7_PUCGR|nr:hypothetical protein PGT21_018814 [Puccinia graminis f. sp. tritici]